MTTAALHTIAGRWRAEVGGHRPHARPYDVGLARGLAHWYIRHCEPLADREPDAYARVAWSRLATIVDRQWRDISRVLDVVVVDDDPYASAEDMHADVERGRLAVMATGEGDHPLWTPEQNDRFRAVHDALGHAASGVGFDRYGEETAYRAHAATMPRNCLAALATETRGQNAALVHGPDVDGRERGTFARQACIVAPVWAWATDAI